MVASTALQKTVPAGIVLTALILCLSLVSSAPPVQSAERSESGGAVANGETSSEAGPSPAAEPAHEFPPLPITWSTGTGAWRGQWGRREVLFCPPGGAAEPVWGTDVYTDDSSVCTAAIHAGLLESTEVGGRVMIEVRPDISQYLGSTRNGVTSGDWMDVWPSSFIFIRGSAQHEPAPAVQIDARTSAESWQGRPGRTVTVLCPPKFELLSVYGAGVYTVDTPICSAGVHAGKITRAKGGMLTIKLLPGQSVYPGSTNKGITSFTPKRGLRATPSSRLRRTHRFTPGLPPRFSLLRIRPSGFPGRPKRPAGSPGWRGRPGPDRETRPG